MPISLVEAVSRAKDLDLIVWPETMFRHPLVHFRRLIPNRRPTGVSLLARPKIISRGAVRYWTGSFGVPILLGIDTMRATAAETFHYNSAFYFDRTLAIRKSVTTKSIG